MTAEEFCSRCLDVIARHHALTVSEDSFLVAEYQLRMANCASISCDNGTFIFWFETKRLNQMIHFHATMLEPMGDIAYEAVVVRAETNGGSLSQWINTEELIDHDLTLLTLSSQDRFPWFANCNPVIN
jgi:hypothetical protein